MLTPGSVVWGRDLMRQIGLCLLLFLLAAAGSVWG
jgi:hypothetical protein